MDWNVIKTWSWLREEFKRDSFLFDLDLVDYQKVKNKYKNDNLYTIFSSIEQFLDEASKFFDSKNDKLKKAQR